MKNELIDFMMTCASCPVCQSDMIPRIQGPRTIQDMVMICNRDRYEHYWIGFDARGSAAHEEIIDGIIRVFLSMKDMQVCISILDKSLGRYTYLTYIDSKDKDEFIQFRQYDNTWAARMGALLDYNQAP